MIPQPPPGQGPVDPQGAFSPPPPPPSQGHGQAPPPGAPFPPGFPRGFASPPPGMMPPPPPGMFPPPMFYPPPQQPQGRGFSKAILVTLATTIFGLSLMANLYLLMYSGLMGGESTTQTTIDSGEETQKVAIVPVHGLITDGTAQWVTMWLRDIEKDPNVKALVIDVDTPGGAVTPADEIHHRIAALRKAKGENFPIAVSMGALATSGGYYVAAHPKVEIFAQPTTLTGNIGVLMPRFNLSELAKKWGVDETTLTAPAGGFKNAGSMFQPEKPEDSAYLQGIIDEAYGNFRDIVKTGRAEKLKGPLSEIANGQVFTFQQAMDKGLVDQKGYIEDAWKWAAAQANLSKPTVVRYHAPMPLFYLFFNEWKGKAPTATGGNDLTVDLKIDAKLIDELMAPRLMYLWRGE